MQVNDDWYEGALRGQQGYFPANYVQLVSSAPPPPPPSPPPSPPPPEQTKMEEGKVHICKKWKWLDFLNI